MRLQAWGGLALLTGLAVSANAMEVDVADAPDSNLALTVSAIQNARSSILLNIYELDAPQITDALIAQIKSGITVRVLEEGQPVGGLSTAAKGAQYQIQQAMQSIRNNSDALFEMTSKAGGKRRYRYDHAKYAVIDGDTLLIGSENYSPTGNPAPGSVGNRGWEVIVNDSAIAQQFQSVFEEDAVTTYSDVLALVGGRQGEFGDEFAMSGLFGSADAPAEAVYYDEFSGRKPRPTTSTHHPVKPRPAPVHKPKPVPVPAPIHAASSSGGNALDASDVQPITSPNTSLDGLVGAINNAQTSIDIEQMTFNSAWNSQTPTSPLLTAIAAAAKRGVQVRVLLNDESVFSHESDTASSSKPINAPTATKLNAMRNVQARIANVKAMGVDYIHNKGMLIDGNYTLISSINWDENSIMNNREAAVLISSPGVFGFYEGLFQKDWDNSASSRADEELSDVVSADDVVGLPEVEAVQQPIACPSTLSVHVAFGRFGAGTDDDYVALSGKSFSAEFAQVSSGDRCLLSEVDRNGNGSMTDRYVELRKIANGSISFTLEGYTPKDQKIYSVHAKLTRASGSLSGVEAGVYEGSGTHQKVGDATLGLTINK